MIRLKTAGLPFLAVASLAAVLLANRPSSLDAARRCTLAPGGTVALLRVESDTTLPFTPAALEPMSASGVPTGAWDSLLATPSTPMPAARVQLLRLDPSTRETLARHGIADSQPIAFIRAAPYRADCRVVRWRDTLPFAQAGETGYVRATLAPPTQWVDGVPLLIIPDYWHYPYPRRRGLAFEVADDAPLAPAEAMFSLTTTLEAPPRDVTRGARASEEERRTRAMSWARSNAAAAELEPVRTLVRREVLGADWTKARRIPSRLRGTYRVELRTDSTRSTWFFRTHDLPGYNWNGGDSLQATAALLASPHALGYRLVGHAAGSIDSLPAESPRSRSTLVWLAVADRPTTPDNDARRALRGVLEFQLAATAEGLWSHLESFVPPPSAMERTLMERMGIEIPRRERQPEIPITVVLDGAGGVRGDTTLVVGGRTLRVSLERVDTISVRRPF